MNYIELFAGCGGLSVGLESLGFELLFANELSPMASETFAYNLLGEDLELLAQHGTSSENVLWLSSRYNQEELAARLRENPLDVMPFDEGKGDLNSIKTLSEIKGKLLVGSIIELNRFLKKNTSIRSELEALDVDLVSGGPPCQSFSLAGLRELGNSRNTLPMDFAEFVGMVRPKIALLENVSGILRAFKLEGGKHFAWFEVARAFASKNYFPICLHVNAKNAGAAQNRPRFIMLAMRQDIFDGVLANEKDRDLREILMQTKQFCESKNPEPYVDYKFFDLEKEPKLFEHSILKPFNKRPTPKDWYNARDAINDLSGDSQGKSPSPYYCLISQTFPEEKYRNVQHEVSHNHALRMNSALVQRRFRIYQIISKAKSQDKLPIVEREILKFLRDPTGFELSEKVVAYMRKQLLLPEKDFPSNAAKEVEYIQIESRQDLEIYLAKLSTKKQTQRALNPSIPAPAALSIPDDACHYREGLYRTLSVREMARFQSFPDWFEFRSKATTGGRMRRFEVPQYTQVGNAVPPLLGRALGEVVLNIFGALDVRDISCSQVKEGEA